MRSSGSRGWLYLVVMGALCILLLGACSKSAGSGAPSTTTAGTGAATTAGTGAATNACTLLTKAEVAQATGNSIAFDGSAAMAFRGFT